MVLEAGTSVRNVETDLHSSYMSMTMASQSTIMWGDAITKAAADIIMLLHNTSRTTAWNPKTVHSGI